MRTLGLVGALVVLCACTEYGINGVDGKQGPPGKDGAVNGYRPRVWMSCTRLLDVIGSDAGLGTDGTTETLLEYRLTAYAPNGDVDVECEAGLGSAESSSSGAYYPDILAGSSNAFCVTAQDYPPFRFDPGNVGAWTFETSEDGPTATYGDDDPGHPLNGYVVPFGDAHCKILVSGDDVMWREVAYSEAF